MSIVTNVSLLYTCDQGFKLHNFDSYEMKVYPPLCNEREIRSKCKYMSIYIYLHEHMNYSSFIIKIKGKTLLQHQQPTILYNK